MTWYNASMSGLGFHRSVSMDPMSARALKFVKKLFVFRLADYVFSQIVTV